MSLIKNPHLFQLSNPRSTSLRIVHWTWLIRKPMQNEYERKLPPQGCCSRRGGAAFKTGKPVSVKLVLFTTSRPRTLKLEHLCIECRFHVSYRLLQWVSFLICRHLYHVHAQTPRPEESSFLSFSLHPSLPSFLASFLPPSLLPFFSFFLSFFSFFFFNAVPWCWERSSMVKLTFRSNGK